MYQSIDVIPYDDAYCYAVWSCSIHPEYFNVCSLTPSQSLFDNLDIVFQNTNNFFPFMKA